MWDGYFYFFINAVDINAEYKNPQPFYVVDRYLRLMGDKTIPA